jgi:hypothetical protein
VVEEVPCLLVDFTGAVLIAPEVQELFIHTPRTELGNLAHILKVYVSIW